MSRLGLLFPGQGAQKPGMSRDMTRAFPAARAVFDAANDALDIELDKLCFEGTAEKLSRSDVAQPAILTASVAALSAARAASDSLANPAAAAGLSLGEYTALVAAGALDFRDAVRLVRSRGIYMQLACDASPGAMYSVLGLDDRSVEHACATARDESGAGVWPANYNCPGQLVISGEKAPTARAAQLCSEAGARRAIHLKVAGAFHTPLMQSAADRLAPELAAVDFRAPSCPVVANVTGQAVTAPDEIRNALLRQITCPVRWLDCINWFIDNGVRHFYELGPGKVLSGLLRRIDDSCTCTALGTAEQVRALDGSGA